MDRLETYRKKRNFLITSEPPGSGKKSGKTLAFCVQFHAARREHYDLRLEWDGAALSWAVPKGPSYCPADKRLAVRVEDHPLEYMDFEGTIPKGEYGGGTVMLWDEGTWTPRFDPEKGLDAGSLKFRLNGHRLKGDWALVRMKQEAEDDDAWLLIKERDAFAKKTAGIRTFTHGIRSGMTMSEIANAKTEDAYFGITLTSPDKIVFPDPAVTKKQLAEYYAAAAYRMLPYIRGRVMSVVCCPAGIEGERFFRRHLDGNFRGIGHVAAEDKEDFFFVRDKTGILSLAQYNAVELHVSGCMAKSGKPDVMIFDLDPDEGLPLSAVRRGVRALKEVLDDLGLVSFLKTSGGKGYHVAVPLHASADVDEFRDFSKQVALLMENAYPDLFTANISKRARGGKIFLDWQRNSPAATSVAPYSVRARPGAPVSMPIRWEELGRIAPAGISLRTAKSRLKRPDPWADFFTVQKCQRLKTKGNKWPSG